MTEKRKKPVRRTTRLETIRQELNQQAEVSIHQLARTLGVSEMTIRRDLAVLEADGEVMRVHGGAASARRVTFEFRFRARQQRNLPQKRAIAAAALQHIEDGDTIILDTGTTTLEIARLLLGRRRARVITASLSIVSELQFAPEIELILLGGVLRDGSPDLHGPLAEQNVELFQADIALLGADAIDPDGTTYTDDLGLLSLERRMARVARRVVVVADSSKLGRRALCRAFRPGDYHVLITDTGLTARAAQRLQRRGITVERA